MRRKPRGLTQPRGRQLRIFLGGHHNAVVSDTAPGAWDRADGYQRSCCHEIALRGL